MTRINCIPPADLTRQHLISEYKEIPRAIGLARAAIERGERPGHNSPPAYTMGKGHVRFFYPRLGYIAARHAELVREMLSRGYSPNFTACLRAGNPDIPSEWWGDWTPDAEAMVINRARIAERLKASA